MHCKSYSHFFSKKFQHICVSLNVNFNESLTNDVVSFEQLGPDLLEHPPSLIIVFAVQWVAKDPSFLIADSEGSDQIEQMPRLI